MRSSGPRLRTVWRWSDADDERAIRELIAATYAAMSSGEPGTDRFFAHPDISIAGSGQGELVSGPEMAARMAEAVTRLGYRWSPDAVTVWVRGDFAWAQILGTVTVDRDGQQEVVPYWTTGVFGREGGEWSWRYWVVPSRRRSRASRPGTRCPGAPFRGPIRARIRAH